MTHGTPRIASDVMTHTVVAIGPEATFKEIVRVMQDRKVSALPVLEGGGRVVGIVCEADLLPKEEFRDSDPDRYTQPRRLSDLAKAGALTAEELMTSPALPCARAPSLGRRAGVEPTGASALPGLFQRCSGLSAPGRQPASHSVRWLP